MYPYCLMGTLVCSWLAAEHVAACSHHVRKKGKTQALFKINLDFQA